MKKTFADVALEKDLGEYARELARRLNRATEALRESWRTPKMVNKAISDELEAMPDRQRGSE